MAGGRLGGCGMKIDTIFDELLNELDIDRRER